MKIAKMLCPLLMVAALSMAAPAPAATVPEQVQELVKQLNSDDFRQRDSAVSKLVGLGPDAADSITQALSDATDVEVKDRLRSALKRIESEATVAATRVTLHLKGATAVEIYTELAKLVGYQLQKTDSRELNRDRFDLDVDHISWLEAIDRAALATGHGIEFGDGWLRITDGPGMAGAPASGAGAVRVQARRVVRTHRIDYRGKDRDSSLQLEMAMRIDPHLRTMARPVLIVSSAVDEKQQSLSDQLPMSLQFSGGEDGTYNATVRLRDIDKDRRQIANFTGNVQLVLITGSREVVLDDVQHLQPTDIESPDSIVHVVGVKKNGDHWELLAEYDAQNTRTITPSGFVYRAPTQSLQDYVTADAIHVTDTQGKRLQCGNPSIRRDGTNMTIAVPLNSPEGTGDPQKIVWIVPTETRLQTFPIKLTDLPLPD